MIKPTKHQLSLIDDVIDERVDSGLQSVYEFLFTGECDDLVRYMKHNIGPRFGQLIPGRVGCRALSFKVACGLAVSNHSLH